jgi:hypothetical protein
MYSTGPAGISFARQPLIRYSLPVSELGVFELGLENPETFYFDGEQLALSDDDRIPDVIARYSYAPKWGNVSMVLMHRELRLDNRNEGGIINESVRGVSIQAAVQPHSYAAGRY